MSRLTDLIAQAKAKDPQLGADLESEFRVLSERRPFGLNFERHQPEAVELPSRSVRKGDKVRVLPSRGTTAPGDPTLWRVTGFHGTGDTRTASLGPLADRGPDQADASRAVPVADLVVVAEFRDPIYPGLVSTGRVERGGSKPFHAVINAENYHALQTLMFTHRGKVDCIYIDPPYNTGAKDWKYNNDYVDGEDLYRHSKWLAFMERRLLLARDLLKPADGVLIVTIDEKEVQRLGLLLRQVLPEARIQMVTIVINPNGVARGAEFGRVEEYAYFCFFGSAAPLRVPDTMLDQGETTPRTSVRWEWLLRGGANALREDRPNLFYPIFVDPSQGRIVDVGEPLPLGTARDTVPDRAGLTTLWPLKGGTIEARWRTSHDYLRRLLTAGHAKLGAYDKRTGQWAVLYLGKAQIARLETGELTTSGRDQQGALIVEQGDVKMAGVPRTVWNRPRHAAGEHGSRMIPTLLPGRSFPFPKSLYAVEDALRVVVGNKPEAVVLDFFSGSGTTAHAVMRLNHADEGRRTSISVTNNEVSAEEQVKLRRAGLRPGDSEWEKHGIAEHITGPRLEAVVSGQTPEGQPLRGTYRFTDEFPMSEGFVENLEFLTLTYETPWRVARNRGFDVVAPLLWLRAGAVGRRIDDVPEQGWDVADAYGVLVNLDRAKQFARAVADADGIGLVFVVTDDDRRFQMVCGELPDTVEVVRLYESYLSNFEINTRRE